MFIFWAYVDSKKTISSFTLKHMHPEHGWAWEQAPQGRAHSTRLTELSVWIVVSGSWCDSWRGSRVGLCQGSLWESSLSGYSLILWFCTHRETHQWAHTEPQHCTEPGMHGAVISIGAGMPGYPCAHTQSHDAEVFPAPSRAYTADCRHSKAWN